MIDIYQHSSDRNNYRNGTKSKNVRSNYGNFEIDVPQDRNSTFEPRIVRKREKDISEIDEKIIAMYSRGLTTRQISDQVEEIYGFECSERFISNVTDKILQDISDWQTRPLDEIYPILFINKEMDFTLLGIGGKSMGNFQLCMEKDLKIRE